ncbi:hypothetical protein PAECIP111893_01301 [Paenibacillus plantiphilus]|uniref:YetF C-terminal domain-containing protein n=1 Tax=Paenibacillus plantiphilus TaxID=2905650 RepID=A0ABM9BZ67_9BACL|nr:DUF421 domain-containing protein [Paenibacillus plantiphilus]CAH1199299.1 hypothetical protein PAECIP111893_01301 [Paenibacillus plantiphilus]
MPNWMEVALRTLLAVVVLFVMTKLLGKRQVSQLSLFEYITGITIGSLAAYISLDLDARWYMGIVSLVVWVAVSVGIEFLQMKSKKGRDFIDGKGTVLVKKGRVLEDNLKKERMTSDELLEQLRKKNVFKVADVEFAMMEPSGDINVMLTKENQPLTAKHLGIKMASEDVPQAVIMDGVIMDEALQTAGYDRAWLKGQLDRLRTTTEQVFLAQVDSNGKLDADLYTGDTQAQLQSQMKQAEKADLYSMMTKCKADLELLGSLAAKNKREQQKYQQSASKLQDVIVEVESLLRK